MLQAFLYLNHATITLTANFSWSYKVSWTTGSSLQQTVHNAAADTKISSFSTGPFQQKIRTNAPTPTWTTRTELLTIHRRGKLSHHGPESALLAFSHLQNKNIVPLIMQQGQNVAARSCWAGERLSPSAPTSDSRQCRASHCCWTSWIYIWEGVGIFLLLLLYFFLLAVLNLVAYF